MTAGAALAGAVIGSLGSAVAQGILQSRRIQADERLAKKKFDYDRHQAVFKRRFELAEQVLADSYRFRSLRKYVRNGASFGSEGQTRKADGYESDTIKHARDNYFVPIERLHDEDKFLGEMFARRTPCRAHFGADVEIAFSKFHMAVHRVRAASGMLVNWTKEHEEPDRELMRQLRDDIWEPMAEHNKNNEVGAMIDEGVAIIEKLCQPMLAWIDAP